MASAPCPQEARHHDPVASPIRLPFAPSLGGIQRACPSGHAPNGCIPGAISPGATALLIGGAADAAAAAANGLIARQAPGRPARPSAELVPGNAEVAQSGSSDNIAKTTGDVLGAAMTGCLGVIPLVGARVSLLARSSLDARTKAACKPGVAVGARFDGLAGE